MNLNYIFLTSILILLAGCNAETSDFLNETPGNSTAPDPMTRQWCENAGGRFDECGSACPPSDEMCILVCVPICRMEDGSAIGGY